MAAQVYCAVLLCLSGCWSSTEGQKVVSFSPGKVIVKGSSEGCVSHKDCSGGYKCCGTVCVPPVFTKPGVCPSTKYEAAMCATVRFVSCVDDNDCAKNQKCCSNGCGLQCMAPVTVNPGVCPSTKYEAAMCAMVRFVSCVDDSDCAKNQKCCSNGCGLQCMAPVTVCPSRKYEAAMCPLISFVSCGDDSDCVNNQKCCNNGCGRQCMTPVTVDPTKLNSDPLGQNQMPSLPLPGVCPSRIYDAAVCAWIRFVSCADDSDCAKNEKCCSNGCGLQCMGPVTAMDPLQVNQMPSLPMPGVCPSRKYDPAVCAWIRFVSCADDSDCAENEKCCSNGCGLQCMGPAVDPTKLNSDPLGPLQVNQIPTLPMPGVCPRRKYDPAVCAWIRFVSCVDDSDCAKKEKCCSNGCGRQCMGPAVDPTKLNSDPWGPLQVNQIPSLPLPGVCPSRKYDPAVCDWIRFVSCVDDSDCAKNQKCCSNGCGRQCMGPAVDPTKLNSDPLGPLQVNQIPSLPMPGVCPSRKYDPAVCDWIRFVSCADDSDCAKNEKCCSNGCGLQCMGPAANPGVCPSRKYEGMCFMKGFVSCADDSDCANNEKCCDTACGGRQCTTAVTVNPGVCPRRKYNAAVCPLISFASCVDDSDCANDEKCCNNGCGLQCMTPDAAIDWPKSNSDPLGNTGVCPNRKYNPAKCARISFVSCADDSDCANNQKCCSNGCGRQCMVAVTANPGVCPSTKYDASVCAVISFASCADDSDCADNQKCCNNGCGLQCMAPVAANPGVCPSTTYEPGKCARIRFVPCADDSECANNEKCCSNGCGLQCMAPVTVNPGVCPSTNQEPKMCFMMGLALCADDSECANNEKCCGTACGGRQCTVAVTANPGVCPSTKYNAAVCPLISFASCADDSDCANNQKCCNNGCGLQCMTPVTVNPGVCPSTTYEAAMCALISFASCVDDSDCANNQKCCNNGCGLQCMAPVTEKPGVCPSYFAVMCFVKAEELCADDSDCPNDDKCCNTACGGRQCMDPDTAVDPTNLNSDPLGQNQIPSLPLPGVCPNRKYSPAKCAWIRFVSCVDDRDCAKNQKCCSNGCGLQCMAPVTANPGVCPVRTYEPAKCARIRFVSCVDDRDCAKNQKCCSNGCGLQCMAPVTVNPGVCPSLKYEAAVCPLISFASCADDSDCANNQKCCNNGCGLQCMTPVTVNPGVCPRRKYNAAMCPLISFASCADDSDCAKNQKCCNNGCGLQCLAPVAAKPGVCPSYLAVMCFVKAEALCADDSDCPNDEKCCNTACGGRQCMDPDTVDPTKLNSDPLGPLQVNQIPTLPMPGVCPSRKYDPAVCDWIRFVSCADDSDCAKNEKCCSNGCGRQCMGPAVDPTKLNSDPWGPLQVNQIPTLPMPGVCPSRKYDPAVCDWIRFVSCVDDSDCAKNQKCCSNGCGRQCMGPAVDPTKLNSDPLGPLQVNQIPSLPMPGVCPRRKYDPAVCAWIRFVSCVDDRDCAKNQKCCSNGCGRQCMGPAVDPTKLNSDPWGPLQVNQIPSLPLPGVCPSRKYDPAVCARIRFVSCADDSDCAKNQKCCSNGCGLQCMGPAVDPTKLNSDPLGPLQVNQIPILPMPVVCPVRTYEPAKCARIRFVPCADDSDCFNNEKCCSNGCGLQCMTPVSVKPGVCPLRKYEEGKCAQIRLMSCANDCECPNNEKCCSTGCGVHQCMVPGF